MKRKTTKPCRLCSGPTMAKTREECQDCVRAHLLFKVSHKLLIERYRRSQEDGFHRHYSEIKRLIIKWRNGWVNEVDIYRIMNIYISIINLYEPYEQRPAIEQAGYMLLELKNLMDFPELWNDKVPIRSSKNRKAEPREIPDRKTCKTCGVEKEAAEFYKMKGMDGLRPDCKKCHCKNVYARYKARQEQC